MQTLKMQVLNAQEIELVVGGAGESGFAGAVDPCKTGTTNSGSTTIATREHG